MIATMLAGGLGNQMFQYAAGRALALRHGTELMLDLSPFRRTDHFAIVRPFELAKLAIEVRPPSVLSPLSFMLARRRSGALRALSVWNIAREQSIAVYDRRFATFPDGTYLAGYWQSWRYFEEASDRIWAELQPRVGLSEASQRVQDRMLAVPSLSLHVRRGDYLTSADTHGFGVLGLDYYTAAVRHVQQHAEGLRAFVFSDDLAWCRQAFEPLGLDLTFVDCNGGEDSWQDLFLMAASRHNVIANSSFSWWGAWLGDHGESAAHRIVVAPKRWFTGADIVTADRCPPRWTTV